MSVPNAAAIAKMDSEIAMLDRQLAERRIARQNAAKAAQDAVKPVYKFTLTPSDSRHDKIYDGSCTLYTLAGILVNKDELEAVGNTREEGGKINYLFNHLSGNFVMRVGGGRVWLTKPNSWDDDAEVLDQLAHYLLDVNIDGGDVTEIVAAFRTKHGKS